MNVNNVGKLFTPQHGKQETCKACRKAAGKVRISKNIRKQYGKGKGSRWKCDIFPNCDACPFPDCIEESTRKQISDNEIDEVVKHVGQLSNSSEDKRNRV